MKPSVHIVCCVLLTAVAAARLEPVHLLDEPGRDPAMWVVDTSQMAVLRRQAAPSVACVGAVCLMVWSTRVLSDEAGDIYCVCTDVSGESLDSVWRPICLATRDQDYPDIAAGLGTCLVVWQDARNGRTDIYAARVDPDGTVLDPGGFPVCTSANDQLDPRVAAGDSCWLVVWTDCRHQADVFGARVSYEGEVLDPGGFVVASAPEIQAVPDVAWNGEVFLAVWKTSEMGAWVTRGARVAPDGEVLDPVGFDIAGDRRLGHSAGHPAVASDSSSFMVAWQNETAERGVFVSRVSASGQVLGAPVELPPSGPVKQVPDIVFSHGQYLVAWHQNSSYYDIWGARLTTDGVVLDTFGILLARDNHDQWFAALTATSEGWLAAWEDRRFDPHHTVVYAIGVDTTGGLSEPERLVDPPTKYWSAQLDPDLVRGRHSYLLVWQGRPTSYRASICGIRLDDSGRPLDDVAINMTQHPRTDSTAAVAYGDSTFLMVCQSSGMRATRVSDDGQVLDPDGILLATTGEAPQVAYGGGVFLVVWYWDTREDEIRAARVDEDGYVLDPGGFTVITGTDTKRNPCVAFDGENFLVVWHTDYYVKGARVRPSGTVLDPYGFTISANGGRFVDVAFDGENYLVVWTTYSRISGARVTPSAQVLDPEGKVLSWGPSGGNMLYPTADFDGSHFVVAWQGDYQRVIRGAMVTRECVRVDSFEVSTAAQLSNPLSPCVTCGPGGGFLVFSGRAGPGMPWDTLPRIWAAHLGLPPDAVGDSAAMPGVQGNFVVRPAMFRQSVRLVVSAPADVAGFRIYDAAGRCVRELGREVVAWDGRDASGRTAPAGVYLVELNGRAGVERRKVVKLE